jgi:hypothetical protein
LAALAAQLPAGQREAVLAEAWQAARAIRHEGARSRALAALAPHLPTGLLAEALQAARALGDEGARSRALAALAPQLPAGQREAVLAEAWQAARAIRHEGACSEALAALAPQLPAGLLAQALQAARALGDIGARSRALAALAPQLAGFPRATLTSLWSETISALATRSRQDLLADLQALTPVLNALAGDGASAEFREITQAIMDVGRWWP